MTFFEPISEQHNLTGYVTDIMHIVRLSFLNTTSIAQKINKN